MASASSQRSAHPRSLSCASAHAPQQQPCRRPPPGILKTKPGFFSFPKGSPTTKTLRFQIPSPTPGNLAQLYAQEEAGQDLVLATAEAVAGERADKSDSSSPPPAEEATDEKFRFRGHKRWRSPSPRRRSSSRSAAGADSVVPYWMPKEIHHYFLNCPHGDEEASGAAGVPGTKDAPSAPQCIGSEQPHRENALAGWRRLARQPHCALATLCFVAALALIFAGTTRNAYVGMVRGARGDGQTPVVAGAGAGGADRAGAEKDPLASKAAPRSMSNHPGGPKEPRAVTAEPTRRHAAAAFDSKEETGEPTGSDAGMEDRSDETSTDAGDDLPWPITVDYAGTARGIDQVVHEFTNIADVTLRSREQTNASCAAPVFSYCSSPRTEYYYRCATNTCESTASDGASVCSRGPNRFSSRQVCQQRCIEGDQPAKACRRRVNFKECARQDVSESWWYHSGKRCHRWTFPRGRCPVSGSDVFKTFGKCWGHCVNDGLHGSSRAGFDKLPAGRLTGQRRGLRPCRVPSTEVCKADKLKYAYFVDSSPTSEAGSRGPRCRSVRAVNQLGHRCLEGANRFRTATACRRACVIASSRH